MLTHSEFGSSGMPDVLAEAVACEIVEQTQQMQLRVRTRYEGLRLYAAWFDRRWREAYSTALCRSARDEVGEIQLQPSDHLHDFRAQRHEYLLRPATSSNRIGRICTIDGLARRAWAHAVESTLLSLGDLAGFSSFEVLVT
jgi:hypothetical protein